MKIIFYNHKYSGHRVFKISVLFSLGVAAILWFDITRFGAVKTGECSFIMEAREYWKIMKYLTMQWLECGSKRTAIPSWGGTKYTTAMKEESASSTMVMSTSEWEMKENVQVNVRGGGARNSLVRLFFITLFSFLFQERGYWRRMTFFETLWLECW